MNIVVFVFYWFLIWNLLFTKVVVSGRRFLILLCSGFPSSQQHDAMGLSPFSQAFSTSHSHRWIPVSISVCPPPSEKLLKQKSPFQVHFSLSSHPWITTSLTGCLHHQGFHSEHTLHALESLPHCAKSHELRGLTFLLSLFFFIHLPILSGNCRPSEPSPFLTKYFFLAQDFCFPLALESLFLIFALSSLKQVLNAETVDSLIFKLVLSWHRQSP